MAYRVQIGDKAANEIRFLPVDVQKRVMRWLDLLAENPFREGTKKLQGTGKTLYRVHAGRDYVVVYTVENRELLVVVTRASHRKDVYRHLV